MHNDFRVFHLLRMQIRQKRPNLTLTLYQFCYITEIGNAMNVWGFDTTPPRRAARAINE